MRVWRRFSPGWLLQVVVGYMIYGFFVGPILGYIFDFHNRVTGAISPTHLYARTA